MSFQAITERDNVQTTIHTTAKQIVELLEAAAATVSKSGRDETREAILALATDDERDERQPVP
jgi:hypothetical protein